MLLGKKYNVPWLFKPEYKFLYFYFLQSTSISAGFGPLSENVFRGDASSVQERW
tara:strand:+ start:564 stop:725 length:162 start_codon:yes stop_codon:yes gene_type:complete